MTDINKLSIFKFLPNEILDIILQDVWYDFFTKNVLLGIKEKSNKLEQINERINKYIHRSNNCQNSAFIHELLTYNKFIKNIINDKGTYMFLLKKYPKYHLSSLSINYINSCFGDIDINLRYICAYSVINGNPYMSYNNKYKFTNIIL